MTSHYEQGIQKEEPKKYRVIQWSTGGVGSRAIRAMARRPDPELVGVWVHSEKKQEKTLGF